jgi:hypothetical protein
MNQAKTAGELPQLDDDKARADVEAELPPG